MNKEEAVKVLEEYLQVMESATNLGLFKRTGDIKQALTLAIDTLKRIEVEKIEQELYRITDRDNLSPKRAHLIVTYLTEGK